MKNTHYLLISTGSNPAPSFPGWRIAQIDGAKSATLKDFYEQIAEALDFPDYFGHNLDSLDELMNDLQWIKEEHILVFIHNSGEWLSKEKSDEKRYTLLDLFEATAEDWKWMDEDEEFAKKELRILFEDSPRIRTLLEEQEIPFSSIG